MKIVNKKKMMATPVFAQLMEQELEVLSNTDHPHIVRHLDLLEDDINFYIISELVGGGELYDYILKVKRLSEKQAASVIRQVLLALNYMHQRNIVHRDIKPENILIDEKPEQEGDSINVKLTDFGFACFFNKEDDLRYALGTPNYMAPEITKKLKYDKKVDVWSVGVVAHTILTGCCPFNGRSNKETFRSIQ